MTSDLWPQPGETVLCAVSGGLDSVCLLHLLKERCGPERVIAAHFNHRLRPTADRDEAFVRELCRQWDVPLTVGREDVAALARREGLSTEEAARKARYAFLYQLSDRFGGIPIYTAHHADDNAETVLLNLLRGTGLRGLTGIPPRRDRLRRPLLDRSREELAAYAAAHGIPHVEDETNRDPDAAARNLLRLQVMPLLKRLNPRVVSHIGETAAQLAVIDNSLAADAHRALRDAEVRTGRVSLPVSTLRSASAALRPRVLLDLLELLGVGRKDFGAVHIEALETLAEKGTGHLDLPYGVTAVCENGSLTLALPPHPLRKQALLPGAPLSWGAYTLTLLDRREGDGLALRRGGEALTVGPCTAGQRLRLPETRGGARTVKRLCLDRQISLQERDRLPAIYADGRLAAVWRLGVDTEFLPEGAPCRFIQIIPITKEELDDEK